MSKHSKEEIARKIRALQAKAGRGATEAEAQAAVEKAQELMIKYNLSQTDINETLETQERRADSEILERFGKKHPYWKFKLAQGVSYAFGCQVLLQHMGHKQERMINYRWQEVWITTSYNFLLIGTDENRLMTRMSYEYLTAVGDQLAKTELKKAKMEGGWIEGRSWSHAFKIGFADRVAERLIEKRREAESGIVDRPVSITTENYALAVVGMFTELAELNKVVLANIRKNEADPQVKLPKSHNGMVSSSEGYYAGRKAGDGVSINRQLKA